MHLLYLVLLLSFSTQIQSQANFNNEQFENSFLTSNSNTPQTVNQEKQFKIDTSNQNLNPIIWINLVSGSFIKCESSLGFSVQYQGGNKTLNSNWYVPFTIGFESFILETNYPFQLAANSKPRKLNFGKIGINPYYRIKEILYINFGFNGLLGFEEHVQSGAIQNRDFFGIGLHQGIFFIPESNINMCFGLSIYERFLDSKLQSKDLGIKMDLGLKF